MIVIIEKIKINQRKNKNKWSQSNNINNKYRNKWIENNIVN